MGKRKFSYNEEDIIDSVEEKIVEESLVDTPKKPEETTIEAVNTVIEYHYNDMELEMFAASNASVKNLPTKEGTKIGKLEAGESVKVTGQCIETEYYRIILNDSEGYVSKSSLVNNKKEEPVIEEDKPIIMEFEFSRMRRKEKKDRRTMVLITGSTKDAVDKLLAEKYQESFNELVNELLDRWVEAHKITK